VLPFPSHNPRLISKIRFAVAIIWDSASSREMAVLFTYQAFVIEATGEYSLSCYFAREPITVASTKSGDEGSEYSSDDLGDFEHEVDAIALAHQWAIDWINEEKLGLAQMLRSIGRVLSTCWPS
jgi:hypothetical protein